MGEITRVRRRSGEARHPGSRGGCDGSSDRGQAAAARWVHRVVCAVAAWLRRRDGGLLGVAPLGTAAARHGHGGEADRAALRLALSPERQDRQERRSRCGGDLRGGFAPQHALRAGQERRAAKHDGAAPVARGLQGRANRLHQPDPRDCWPSSAWSSRSAPKCCVQCCRRSSKTRANELGAIARMALQRAHLHWIELECHIAWCDERIAMHVRSDEQAKAAARLCGVGPVTASALVATVDDFKQFKNGRQFSAWMGLVPRQSSSGGKAVLGRDHQARRRISANSPDPGRQVSRDSPRTDAAIACHDGSSSCAIASVGRRPRWRWPTSTRASCGRYWSRVRASIRNTYRRSTECHAGSRGRLK